MCAHCPSRCTTRHDDCDCVPVQESGCVTVFYLDYGNYRHGVARAELRVLLEQFSALPALAIHCALPITAITWVRTPTHCARTCSRS